jgi:hypothetical protein
MDPVYRIRPWAEGWGVFASRGEDIPVSPELMRTSADAVAHARELARRAGGGFIVVFDEDGRIRSELFQVPDHHHEMIPSLAMSEPYSKPPPPPRKRPKHVRSDLKDNTQRDKPKLLFRHDLEEAHPTRHDRWNKPGHDHVPHTVPRGDFESRGGRDRFEHKRIRKK